MRQNKAAALIRAVVSIDFLFSILSYLLIYRSVSDTDMEKTGQILCYQPLILILNQGLNK